MSLRASLAAEANAWRKLNAPPGAWMTLEFLVRKGVAGHPQRLPDRYPRMMPKACFQNAAQLVRNRSNLRFCEGYVVRDSFPIYVLHAWAIDRDDRVIDPTLEEPERYEYVGYPMSLATRRRWIKPPNNISVLDTGSGINFKFMLNECPELIDLIDTEYRSFIERKLKGDRL